MTKEILDKAYNLSMSIENLKAQLKYIDRFYTNQIEESPLFPGLEYEIFKEKYKSNVQSEIDRLELEFIKL